MKRLLFPLTLFMVTFVFLAEKSIAQKADEETILGSGTMNYIPLFTDTYEIGNSIIYSTSGNVGISTTSPLSKLSVNGGLSIGSYAGVNAAPSNGMIVSGNIGIGTSTPNSNYKLDVNGDVSSTKLYIGTSTKMELFKDFGNLFKIKSPDASSGWGYDLQIQAGSVLGTPPPPPTPPLQPGNVRIIGGSSTQTAGDVYIYGGTGPIASYNGNVILGYNGSQEIGYVSIGTNSSNGYKLNVNGKIRANEIVVNTTGADFVFQENYNLRSLTEVETFIKENKHLPEIPNAEEMQQDGMSLSEMNTKLLQKVEELTLYIIDQEKRINALENKE